jgi:adenylate cyclase, class 2
VYEVEMKFPVADMASLERRLADFEASIDAGQLEVDVYFAHPARDFTQTDEALRIRRKGPTNSITYKGPKIDAVTKTRREIDLGLPSGEESAQVWTGLLESLGFTVAGEVCKLRRKAHIDWQSQSVEVSLDDVQQLGTFAELELIVDADGIEAARACLTSLAEVLKLEAGERRSYLELLLDRQ